MIQVSDHTEGIDVSVGSPSSITVKKDGSVIRTYDLFPIKDLPKLSAGEHYEITYEVKPGSEITSKDGSAKVKNTASASDGKNNSSKEIIVDVSKPDVNKTHWSDGSFIWWTITLNSNHKNIQGKTLKDVINAVNVNNSDKIVLPDEVEIWSDTNYTPTTHSFTNGQITFPIEGYGDTSEYTIRYKTARPVGNEGSHISVSNKAEFNDRSSESTYEEDVQVKDYGVNKWNIEDEGKDVSTLSDSEKGLTWTARIDMPSSNVDLNKIIYSDEIKDQDGIQNSEMHYTTTKTLIDSFQLWTEKGYELEYGTDYWISLNGQYVSRPGNDDKITSFQLIFTDDFIQNRLNGSTCISMRYQTIANVSGLTVGNQRLFQNSASIPDKPEVTKKYTYSATGDLDKQSSGSGDGYSSSGVKVNLSKGEIYYRVSLRVGNDTQDITLTDTLPEGLEIDETSIDAKRTGSAQYQPNEYYVNPWNGGTDIRTCLSKSISDNKRVLNISLKNYQDNGFQYIAIYYKAKIKDPRWQDNKDLQKLTYENQITWIEKNIHDSTVTEVDRDVKTLEKNVQQVQKESGLTDDLEYSLVVNPLGRDLIPTSDSIQVHDQLTGKENADDSEARFLPDSVMIFEYDAEKKDSRGAVVDPNRYSYSYDTESTTITFNIPDSFPCVIVYRYHIIPGVNLPTFSNTAYIENVSESRTEISKKLDASSSAAHAKQSVLYLYKVDADDYRIKLPDVEFTLSEYDASNNGKWSSSEGTFKTDGDGLIKLFAGSASGSLKKDTLYRLTETNNPNQAYQANSVITFFWESEKGAFKKFWDNNKWKIKDVEETQVHTLSDESLLMIPNKKYNSITVNKIWLGSDGKGLDSFTCKS